MNNNDSDHLNSPPAEVRPRRMSASTYNEKDKAKIDWKDKRFWTPSTNHDHADDINGECQDMLSSNMSNGRPVERTPSPAARRHRSRSKGARSRSNSKARPTTPRSMEKNQK